MKRSGRAWTWLWRAAVLLLFPLCYLLPGVVLVEHGAAAAVVAIVAIVCTWILIAGRRASFMSDALFWLLCLTLPELVSRTAWAVGGAPGAAVGIAMALAGIVLPFRLTPPSICALLPNTMLFAIAIQNSALVARNVIVIVRGYWG